MILKEENQYTSFKRNQGNEETTYQFIVTMFSSKKKFFAKFQVWRQGASLNVHKLTGYLRNYLNYSRLCKPNGLTCHSLKVSGLRLNSLPINHCLRLRDTTFLVSRLIRWHACQASYEPLLLVPTVWFNTTFLVVEGISRS